MRMRVGLALFALSVMVVSGAGVAVSQDDPIAARQQLMKNNGAAMGALNAMVKGDAPFDAAAAKAAFQTLVDDMTVFPTLFPDGSDTGDTKAGPAIWSDRAGFEAASAKLATDAAAAAASVTTLDEPKAAFPTVGGNCGACHQKYRS
jgi:cytochrome c556